MEKPTASQLVVQTILVIVTGLVFAGETAQANTTLFNTTGTVCTVTSPCYQAGSFGVLIGLPSAVATMTLSGNSSTVIDISGAVGVGAGSRITGGNGISTASNWDIVDFADPLATQTNGPLCPNGSARCSIPTAAANNLKNVSLDSNSTRHLSSYISAAMQDVYDMSNYWAGIGPGAYSGTVINQSFSGSGTTTLGVAANSAGNITVYNATSSLGTGRLLTIQGDENDLVIINFGTSRTASFNNANAIQLTGGITSDNVLFNFSSANTGANALQITGGTVKGTFIVAGTNYRVAGNTTVDGRILGGSGSLTWGNNSNPVTFNSPADVDAAGLPEPSTWILMGTGMAGLIYFGRRRAQRP